MCKVHVQWPHVNHTAGLTLRQVLVGCLILQCCAEHSGCEMLFLLHQLGFACNAGTALQLGQQGSARITGHDVTRVANTHPQPALSAGKPALHVADLQRIGLKVLRLWGFNSGVPYEPGRYDDKKATGLDYVIAGAAKRGLRVELALANFWPGE
jgi:hypothetical protein